MKRGTLLYVLLHVIHLAIAGLVLGNELNDKALAVTFGYSLFVFFITLLNWRHNFLYMMRTFFLGAVGLLAFGVKLAGSELLFGFHMPVSQTREIALMMYCATILAIAGSELGFFLAGKLAGRPKPPHPRLSSMTKPQWQVLGILGFCVALLGGQLIANHMGPLVWLVGYGTQEKESSLVLNNLNSIVNISIFLLLLAFLATKGRLLGCLLVFTVAYVLVFCEFLRGVRMDVINCLLGCYAIYQIRINGKIHLKPQHLVLLLLGFMVVQIMGAIRSVLSLGVISYDDLITVFGKLVSMENASGIAFYQGTINDIATTFSGVIFLLKSGIVEPLLGQSYIDYILRTPPEFIYPNRPDDLAWLFEQKGFTSGGGFFELAEAFYNFGYLGCFFIPASISFIIAKTYLNVIINGRLWHYFALFAIMSVWMRGLLYMSFSFWKAYVTAVILYFIFLALSSLLTKILIMINRQRSNNNSSCAASLG